MNAEAAKLPLHTAMVICKPVTKPLNLARHEQLPLLQHAGRTVQVLMSNRAAQQSAGLSPAVPYKEPHASPLRVGPECSSTGRGMLAGSGSERPADGKCLCKPCRR